MKQFRYTCSTNSQIRNTSKARPVGPGEHRRGKSSSAFVLRGGSWNNNNRNNLLSSNRNNNDSTNRNNNIGLRCVLEGEEARKGAITSHTREMGRERVLRLLGGMAWPPNPVIVAPDKMEFSTGEKTRRTRMA